MAKPSPTQPQPEDSSDGQAMYAPSAGLPRRISVKACQGEGATIVVTVVQGKVWLSISPLFTWEVIMELGKVDEMMRVLGVAREEASRMAAALSKHVVHGESKVVRKIRGGATAPGNKAE